MTLSLSRTAILAGRGLVCLLVCCATMMARAQESRRPQGSLIDRILLDPAIRRAGQDPTHQEAEAAKALGKDWLNPFASEEDLRDDLEKLRRAAAPSEAALQKVYENESLTDTQKRAEVERILGAVRECPKCGRRFPLRCAYCPHDGHRLALAESPEQASWKGKVAIWANLSDNPTKKPDGFIGLALQEGISLTDLDAVRCLQEVEAKRVRGIFVGAYNSRSPNTLVKAIRCAEQGARVFIEAGEGRGALGFSEVNDVAQQLVGARSARTRSLGQRFNGASVLPLWQGLYVGESGDRCFFVTELYFDKSWLELTALNDKEGNSHTLSGYRRIGEGEIILCATGYGTGSADNVYSLAESPTQYDNKTALLRLLRWLEGSGTH